MRVDNATLVVCAVVIAVTGTIAYLLMRRHEKRLAAFVDVAADLDRLLQ